MWAITGILFLCQGDVLPRHPGAPSWPPGRGFSQAWHGRAGMAGIQMAEQLEAIFTGQLQHASLVAFTAGLPAQIKLQNHGPMGRGNPCYKMRDTKPLSCSRSNYNHVITIFESLYRYNIIII